MNKVMKLVAAGLLASTMSVPAMAVVFSGNYSTAAHNSGNGLLIQTSSGPQSINFDIDVGQTYTDSKLFKIWTNESDVSWGEDTQQKNFTLTFNFTTPDFDGVATGVTFGAYGFLTEKGVLQWSNNGVFDFAYGNGGLLSLKLSDADFNKGFLGLNEGSKHGDWVSGEFTLVSSAVPEPATWLTMIAGFGMVGFAMRNQRKSVAAAA